MSLLLDKDYQILADSGLDFEEDEVGRFLIIKNFPLQTDLYTSQNEDLKFVEILVIIPPNYNTSGNDMFWTHPELKRKDGKKIPQAFGFGGGDARHHNGKEYCRWSRHYKQGSWQPKMDNVQKIIDRIEWALKKPDGVK